VTAKKQYPHLIIGISGMPFNAHGQSWRLIFLFYYLPIFYIDLPFWDGKNWFSPILFFCTLQRLKSFRSLPSLSIRPK